MQAVRPGVGIVGPLQAAGASGIGISSAVRPLSEYVAAGQDNGSITTDRKPARPSQPAAHCDYFGLGQDPVQV